MLFFESESNAAAQGLPNVDWIGTTIYSVSQVLGSKVKVTLISKLQDLTTTTTTTKLVFNA